MSQNTPVRQLMLLGLSIAAVCFSNTNTLQAEGFDDMISPVSNPINFEDPRAITELRPLYLYHELGDKFATAGGDVQVYALQARFALTDRLALIATKDGYVDFNPNETLAKDSGWANIAAGFKYAFYMDQTTSSIATAGLRYEIPLGDDEVLQGEGDGVINPFLSGATKLGQVNAMAAGGLRLPIRDDDSTFLDLDLHFDVPVGDIGIGMLYPLFELNLVQVLDDGKRLPIADEGADVINIGASDAEGKGIVTMATGFRIRAHENVDFGLAYQVPLTRGAGSNLFDWRLTTDVIVRFDPLS